MINFFLGKPETLGRKIRVTIALIFLYVLGTTIPLPFVDGAAFQAGIDESTLGTTLAGMMSIVGSSLSRLGLFSLGVMPYITASIIFSLLKFAIPRLKEIAENEKERVTQWTRYLSIFLAATTGFTILYSAPKMLGVQVFPDSFIAFIIAWFAITVGAVITMRLGELVTAHGVTNGTSLLIFTSILAGMPSLILNAWVSHKVMGVVGFALIILGILGLAAFIEQAIYKVRVTYPKTSLRQVPSRSFIPIKVAIAGVLPVIFSSTFMSIPMLLGSFMNSWTRPGWLQAWTWLDGQWLLDISNAIPFGSFWYSAIYAVLTVAMTFFSVPMVFDTEQIADQVSKGGGIVEGVKGAGPLRSRLNYLVSKMAGIDALYLIVISAATLFLFPVVGIRDGAFGATSIIILTTVVVTLLQAVRAEEASSKENLGGFLV